MIDLAKAKKEICRVFAEFLEKKANVSFSPRDVKLKKRGKFTFKCEAIKNNRWPRAEGTASIIGKNKLRIKLVSTWISSYLPGPKYFKEGEQVMDITCAKFLA